VTLDRSPTRRPLTPIQEVVATLVGLRYSYEAIGRFVHVRAATVKQHVEDPARNPRRPAGGRARRLLFLAATRHQPRIVTVRSLHA
jgi:hypothetical protein